MLLEYQLGPFEADFQQHIYLCRVNWYKDALKVCFEAFTNANEGFPSQIEKTFTLKMHNNELYTIMGFLG